MKNKILLAGVLAIVLIFAGNASAVGQGSDNANGEVNQVEQQTQTANQGESSQIQQQTQQELQEGSGTGTEAQNQNQVQNQGETNQLQNQEQEATQAGSASQDAEKRRAEVANAVQQMLQLAQKNSGVLQQVKTTTQTQTQNQEKMEASLQKVQSRSGFVKFLIGPNYGEISNAKKMLEQNREQIKQLNEIKNQLSNQGDQQKLTQHIQILEKANLEIENSLNASERGFSLLGWMFRLFAKK